MKVESIVGAANRPDSLPLGALTLGTRYRVSCVRIDQPAHRGRRRNATRRWVPVLGPVHHDPEIGTPYPHIHYDVRFMSDDLLRWLFAWFDPAAEPLGRWGLWRALSYIHKPQARDEWGVRRFPVYRQMPRFAVRGDNGTSSLARTLERLYADVRLPAGCLVCPHRGLPLAGLPVEGGAVVCPGHGLRWSLETGCMVPRVGDPDDAPVEEELGPPRERVDERVLRKVAGGTNR